MIASQIVGRGAAHNPFSSERVRPGAIPYLMPEDNLGALIETLRRNRLTGQIVGPHGTGKSTLLATLADALERHGYQAEIVDADLFTGSMSRKNQVLLLDSAERIPGRLLRNLLHHAQCCGGGIVVTAHSDL